MLLDFGAMISRGRGFEDECEESGDGRADGRLRLRARSRNAQGPTAPGTG